MPLSRLNAEQLQAARAAPGHNLIIASAGTGKTSTIVGRIAHLMQSGLPPEKILLLTFTNKAASEMVSRLAGLFGKEAAGRIEAGTFHAVSYRWLKNLGMNVVLKDPRELRILFKSIYEKRRFHTVDERCKPYSAQYLYEIYSLYVNSSNLEFDAWIMEQNQDHELYTEIYMDIFEEFNGLKNELNYCDYNDLLLKMRQKAEESDSPFEEALVDEYQDTNPLQQSLIESINPPSLFCVGDYDQSIYAFNGADISIISGFRQRHEKANVFTLSKNYRSTGAILSLANTVIEKNERIYPKKLEVVRDGVCENPKLLLYNELFEQYQGIAHKIQQSHREHDEIAVIYRNNSSADGIEASLRELGIKSRRKGGMSFFDAKEVRALLDILMIMINPKDMMAFIHILAYGKGIGNAIAKDLYEALGVMGDGNVIKGLMQPIDVNNPFPKRAKNTQLGLFDDFHDLGSVARFAKEGFPEKFLSNPVLKHPKMTVEGAHFLHDFYDLIKTVNPKRAPSVVIPAVANHKLFQKIAEMLATRRATQKDGSVNETQKREAIDRITRKVILLRDLGKHYADLYRFLNAMILGGNEMSEGEGVNLLSVHASKGLEFQEVYIIDLMDGRFPNRKLMVKSGSLDEERRLFYVAVTRAKDSLHLSYARYDSVKKMDYLPSQFLYEAGILKEKK